MNGKLRLQILNEDGSVNTEMRFKTYRAVAKQLNLEYHVVRAMEQLTDKKVSRKYLHPTLKEVSKKFKLFQDIDKFDSDFLKKLRN